MAELSILHFPVVGQDDRHFVLQVSSNGSRPLDLKLIGSEGSAVFLHKVRDKKIGDYMKSSGHCTEKEWEQILLSTFVEVKPVPDIEVRAELSQDGTSVTLSFRKNIQGITQRLGSIRLKEEGIGIEPYDWCVSALLSRSKVTEELVTANAKIGTLEESIKELKAHLEDLITSKAEDETILIEKFQDLLNEKKAKIRQQQRLLAAAKVDTSQLPSVGASSHAVVDEESDSPGPPRPRKRKAETKVESESDADLDTMDIDDIRGSGSGKFTQNADEDQDDDQDATEDDATESAPDTESEDEAPRARGKAASPSGRNTRAAKPKAPVAAHESSDESDGDAEPSPPKRTLPVARGKKVASPPKSEDGDETPSDDDDEL
ncbi:hypothetical protein GGR57DRAFT_352280 [Xylariaceae sp. FL1272]|nr:hypothetical protein GGR57DRAFT_352280 [Xylariaceae sp. FL1272]